MSRPRVLYVCHNHPSIRPGGAELYALELYEAQREAREFEPFLIARTDRPSDSADVHGSVHALEADPNQYLIYTEGRYDHVLGVSAPRGIVTRAFRDLLEETEPDVVHFQHTLFLGYDLVTAARATLPTAPIVYTLHEYQPICFHFGQMVRTEDGALCAEASPERCHQCFPELSPGMFLRRQRFIQSHLAHVDLFLAPSRFLRDRYVDWGIPPEKIVYEEYGRLPVAALREQRRSAARNRLGFFGQLTPFKGADVLLTAMSLLAQRGVDVKLRVHGANLDVAQLSIQHRFWQLLDQAGDSVRFLGSYGRDELRPLMHEIDWVVVPSTWWENSPLVIQEAFAFGRPVICSGIGGMAEKVRDGISGLHFRVGDPVDLAATIERAVSASTLWDELRAAIPPVYSMTDHLSSLNALYESLVAARSGAAVHEQELAHA